MVEQLLEMLREIEGNDELSEVMARLMKKNYDALVKVGFSEEQATQIVASQGFGVLKS